MNALTETIKNSDDGSATSESALHPHLFVVLEAGRPLAGGASIRLEGIDELILGRAPLRSAKLEIEGTKKRIVVGIPDGRMSGRHAKLARTLQGFVLEDMQSTNGTFIGAERVTHEPLVDGTMFDCGSTLFLFRAALPAPAIVRDVFVESQHLPHQKFGIASLVPSHAKNAGALAHIATAGDVPILILGESGTGKEVTARAVHSLSQRNGAFVPVNCGALPETLLESQLFGHMKGAFSGAQRDEPGLVRASHGGTLFLDELGDMPKPSQVALLRVLQEKEVTPVGATKPVRVDLRVVAATHRAVESLEAAGFRSDLYARVAGYTYRLPPLRSRLEDLGMLVADLLPKVAPDRAASLSFAIDFARALLQHGWPLNVRELEQALRVTALLADDGTLRLANAPDSLRHPSPASDSSRISTGSAITEDDLAIKNSLVASLQAHGGNVTHIAKDLGKTRMQIHRWMKRFGLDPETYRR